MPIEEPATIEVTQENAKARIRSIVERVERLEKEKASIAADIREVYAEAKSAGYDTKALRQVVKIRKQDDNERMEQEALLATYMHALGMLSQIDMFPEEERKAA